MKNKKQLNSLKLNKKIIGKLGIYGGEAIKSKFPHTYQQGCVTDPRICDPASYPIDCYPLDTVNCPLL